MIVASFFAPREDKWGCDYDALLRLLDASCRRFNLQHVVISDSKRPGLDTLICRLPNNLMMALLDGQRQCLEWAREPVLFVGADCLLARDPRPVMAGDMTITIGPFSDCPMNTGAIWCADPNGCATVWRAAVDAQPVEWGDDQRAFYSAVEASGLNIRRVPCQDHNWAPRDAEDPAGMPTVVHFRGDRKAFMADWAKAHLNIVA